MEDFLFGVIVVVLFVRWLVLSRRFRRLERSLDSIGALTQRVFALEQALKERAVVVEEAPPPPVVIPEPEPEPAPAPQLEPEPMVVAPALPPPLPPPLPQPILESESEPEPEPVMAGPTLSERMREKMSGEEWEAIVGGSWLNKAGVFLLVVGMASMLGLAYSGASPFWRDVISLAVSFVMLGGGVWLERKARYNVFARGLIGGGWAALYFTTYAMHAVDAAKIIYDPLVGGVLLLAVAAGMIGHSLKYRSQTVTGLAYFIAFVTLAMASSTPFAVVALIPLAASMLYVAYRFQWSEMALLGLIATYGTCASRGDSGASIIGAQTLFSIYWVMFEAFDLFRAARRTDTYAERAILPLNALAFGGLSYVKWSHAAPQNVFALAAGIGALYFISTALRAWVRPPSSFAPEQGTMARIFGGGYEGPVTIAAAGSAVALLLKFHGVTANWGLLAEAQILFLAGLFFKEAYPRHVATSLFTVVLGKIVAVDLDQGTKWVPSGIAEAVLLYLNRALRKPDHYFGYAAAGICALIIGVKTPDQYMGMAWLGFAAAAFAFGWALRLQDFRLQGYCVAALGFCGAGAVHTWRALTVGAAVAYAGAISALRSAEDRFSQTEREALRFMASWITTAGLAALVWRLTPEQWVGVAWIGLAIVLLELGLRKMPREFVQQAYAVVVAGVGWVLFVNVFPVHNDGLLRDRLTTAFAALAAYLFAGRVHMARESKPMADVISSAGTLFGLTALWALLPAEAVAPAWAALSLLLLEGGLMLDMPSVRLQAHASGAAAFGRLFFANFTGMGDTAGISHRMLSVIPVVVAHYYSWTRVRDKEPQISRGYLYTAAIMLAVLMRFELGRSMVAAGWALFALALIWFGQRWNNVDLRWQSFALAGVAFFRSWITDFYDPTALAGAPQRIAIGAVVIASFFAAQLVVPQPSRARTYFSLLSTVLLTIVLFHEVSGSMLTVAWGIEGVGLLISGFPLRDRTLRLSGLSLFLICMMKLFFYDLRNLETMYRILSFIVLGLIMVSVSWVYTRFRDHVKRYL